METRKKLKVYRVVTGPGEHFYIFARNQDQAQQLNKTDHRLQLTNKDYRSNYFNNQKVVR